jgi:hypothetical protein
VLPANFRACADVGGVMTLAVAAALPELCARVERAVGELEG